jgi:hypothetical protein
MVFSSTAVAVVTSMTRLRASENLEARPPPVVVFDLPPDIELYAPKPILLLPYYGP